MYHYFNNMKKLSKLIESIWSDIQDRSAGDVVRREDMIITNEELTNKIKQLYKEQGNGDTLNVSSLNKYKFDDLSYLFYNLEKVKQIIGLETWDVSNVTDMSSMFSGCESLTELDISNWDVSNVTNMGFMFSCCQNLTELNISNWDVSNVTNMNGMFNVCENLTELNISNLDVSNVTNMGFMFDHCSSLTELNIDNWDVNNVTHMSDMFSDCDKLIKPKWYNE